MTEATAYSYNKQGNIIETLDPLGQRTEYDYDAAGQLKELRSFSSSGVQNQQIDFTYDAAGNLKSYDDGVISASYDYDSQHRKTSETVNYPGFSKSFSYTYGENGLKETFSMPGGPTYTYTYGDGNLLESLMIPDLGDISYPSYTMGRPDSVVLPTGVQQDYAYDPMMRLNGITAQDSGGETLLHYDYTHDSSSNILTKVTEHGNYRYGYDKVSRLTAANNPEPLNDESYNYDGVGNRLTASGVSGTILHNQNNELESYGDISYEYDANGNMVRKSSGAIAERYVYNVANRLTRIEDESTESTIAEYYYDPFGRRLWKEVDGIRTYFFYSDEGLVAEYDSSGNELKAYGYQPDSIWTTDPVFLKQDGEYFFYQNDHLGTPQKLVDEERDSADALQARYSYGSGIDEPLTMERGGEVYYYHRDGLGSVSEISDQSGALVERYEYDVYGAPTISDSNDTQLNASVIGNPYLFTGRRYDPESGNYYYRARIYSPDLGRFLQSDPLGYVDGLNLYAYVGNNPVNFVDLPGYARSDDVGKYELIEFSVTGRLDKIIA